MGDTNLVPENINMQKEYVNEVSSSKPRFMIFFNHPISWLSNPKSDNTIVNWFNGYSSQYYKHSVPLLSSGSYWDQYSEFDILAITADKKLILGECKYKERKICKNELNKLKDKALQSGIIVDIYALFSKSGFSNELMQIKEENILLFDLNDLKQLLQ
jgi:hypothetical protein